MAGTKAEGGRIDRRRGQNGVVRAEPRAGGACLVTTSGELSIPGERARVRENPRARLGWAEPKQSHRHWTKVY